MRKAKHFCMNLRNIRINRKRIRPSHGVVTVRGSQLVKKSRRVRCRSSEKNQIIFPPGRVPGGKYISGSKCGNCLPTADNFCARQTAAYCRKTNKVFRQSKTLSWRCCHERVCYLWEQGEKLSGYRLNLDAKSNPAPRITTVTASSPQEFPLCTEEETVCSLLGKLPWLLPF